MAEYSIREAADLLGVSDDTVRRWIGAGRLAATSDAGSRTSVDGEELATLAEERGRAAEAAGATSSARNRLIGIVTKVVKDGVMAQVELQAGPYRIVSLLSREAADELGLARGVPAVASVKSTNVVVELPR